MSRYPLIAAILFLCAAPTSAQLQLARIDGTVLGPTDEAQAGARVVLLDSLGSPVAETTTAADGHFSFPAIVFGRYVIRAGAASMETVAVPVSRRVPARNARTLAPARAPGRDFVGARLELGRQRAAPRPGCRRWRAVRRRRRAGVRAIRRAVGPRAGSCHALVGQRDDR